MGNVVHDAVERYLATLNRLETAERRAVAEQGAAMGLPIVDAEVGALLQVLTRAVGARQALEIGTANGYSGLWIASALPDAGMLFTIEIDPGRAATARENFERAGLASRVSVMVGDAARLVAKLGGPFDLIFQDGDKLQYSALLDQLIALLRPGGLLITDNVLWDGEVVPGFVTTPARPAELTAAISAYNQRLAAEPRLATSVVPLRDGLAISVRRDPRD